MLKFHTKVQKSLIPNAGLGLFALTDIPMNAVVWRYTKSFDHKINSLPPSPAREFVIKYGYKPYKDPQRHYLSGDNMRFINHSVNPNLVPDFSVGFASYQLPLIANRRILSGSELTINYPENYLTDDPGSQRFYPFCGRKPLR